jgi:hypothetical protein
MSALPGLALSAAAKEEEEEQKDDKEAEAAGPKEPASARAVATDHEAAGEGKGGKEGESGDSKMAGE